MTNDPTLRDKLWLAYCQSVGLDPNQPLPDNVDPAQFYAGWEQYLLSTAGGGMDQASAMAKVGMHPGALIQFRTGAGDGSVDPKVYHVQPDGHTAIWITNAAVSKASPQWPANVTTFPAYAKGAWDLKNGPDPTMPAQSWRAR